MQIDMPGKINVVEKDKPHSRIHMWQAYMLKQWQWHRLLFWVMLLAFLIFSIAAEAGHLDRESIVKSFLYAAVIILSVIIIDTTLITKFYQSGLYGLFFCFVGMLAIVAVAIEIIAETILLKPHPFGLGFKVMESTLLIMPWIFIALVLFLTEAHFKGAIQKKQEELDYLKQQINPHFLLNTHNNIFFLIEQDPATASAMLMKLSSIMRYALYESGNDYVALSRELQNIRDYIALEEIRKNDHVVFNLDITKETADLLIAPLILMTFVENACKHLSDDQAKQCGIDISIHLEGDWLHAKISNSVKTITSHKKGIGLLNAKKRLELLYTRRYQLNVWSEADRYNVFLKIKLAK